MKSIILKKNVFDEGSEIITFYTEEQGKVRAVARAVKSSKSKLAHGLQQLFYSEIETYAGSTASNRMQTITGAKTINVFKNLREDLNAIYAAMFACELVLKSTADNQANPELFTELLNLFEHLDTNSPSPHVCADVFALRLLDFTGYGIDTRQCLVCMKEIEPEHAFFSIRKGGFACASCAGKIADVKKISSELYLFLDAQSTLTYAEIDQQKVSPKELHHFADSFATHILERNLNASKYLGTLK